MSAFSRTQLTIKLYNQTHQMAPFDLGLCLALSTSSLGEENNIYWVRRWKIASAHQCAGSLNSTFSPRRVRKPAMCRSTGNRDWQQQHPQACLHTSDHMGIYWEWVFFFFINSYVIIIIISRLTYSYPLFKNCTYFSFESEEWTISHFHWRLKYCTLKMIQKSHWLVSALGNQSIM